MNLIKLEWRERKSLERLSKQTSDATTLRRAQALLWLDHGECVADVAGRLGVSRQVIYQWIEIFALVMRKTLPPDWPPVNEVDVHLHGSRALARLASHLV
jgi:Homeodomain-like domain